MMFLRWVAWAGAAVTAGASFVHFSDVAHLLECCTTFSMLGSAVWIATSDIGTADEDQTRDVEEVDS